MKKLSIAVALMAMLLGTSAFAGPEPTVSSILENALRKNFAGATNVNWEFTPDFNFANFVVDGKTVDAAFNEEGDLLGFSRNIHLTEVPKAVLESLQAKYPDFTISSQVAEVRYEGKTFYNVVAQDKKKILKLKCLANGRIFVESRFKK